MDLAGGTLIVEGVPWLVAVMVYLGTRTWTPVRLFVYLIVVAFLTLAWLGNFSG